MNKTFKTIAWICLVLGILGIAVDVGMAVRVQTFRTRVAEQVAAGELPAVTDKENGGKSQGDGDSRQRPGIQDGKAAPGGGVTGGKRGMIGRNPRRYGLPIVLIAAGPVLAVVGGVMLIVNRAPKEKDLESKTKKTNN